MIKTVFLASGKTRLKEVKQTKTRAVETGKKGRGRGRNRIDMGQKVCYSVINDTMSEMDGALFFADRRAAGF